MPRKKTQSVYAMPQGWCRPSRDEPLEYIVPCPVCERRVFDVSELPSGIIKIRFKCPHCNTKVQMPLSAKLYEGSLAFKD